MKDNPFADLYNSIDEINSKLDLLCQSICKTNESAPETNEFISVAEACNLLNITKSTLYGMVHKRQIPNYKTGKLLKFSKIELQEHIKSGRRQTKREIESNVRKS